MGARYEVVVDRASAAEFHARTVPDPPRPAIWHHRITGPALVLGSAQSPDVVDAEACRRVGVDIVRRRSGGGAVLLTPGEVTWVDVIVPRGSAGWAADVHAPMVWLGDRLAEAFALAGAPPTAVHRGRLRSTPWSTTICFDGLGAGELTSAAADTPGAKLIGMSQRRTRGWARLQCCWYSRHDHADLTALLVPDHRPEPDRLGAVATVPRAIGDAAIEELPGVLDP